MHLTGRKKELLINETKLAPFSKNSGTDRTNVCWVKGCSFLKPAACYSLPLEVVDHVNEFDSAKLNLHLNKGCYTADNLQAQLNNAPASCRHAFASRSLGSTVTWARAITISPTGVTWDRSPLPRPPLEPDRAQFINAEWTPSLYEINIMKSIEICVNCVSIWAIPEINLIEKD